MPSSADWEADESQGRDYNLDLRFGGSDTGVIAEQAKELVRSAPDVILTQSNLAMASLLKETRDIPIVGTVIGDPVGSGFIKSLSQPGGNATGFTELRAAACSEMGTVTPGNRT